jgi:hypothetical protein
VKPVTIRVDRCHKCGATLRERTTEKNAHLHALLGEIARQKQWAGQWLSIEQWKRLMVAAFERTQGRTTQLFPAVDGTGLDVIYSQTSRMSQDEIRDLILYVEAWASDNEIELTPLEAR